MLLETELAGDAGLGGRTASDCDMANCASSSSEELEELRDAGLDVATLRESNGVGGNETGNRLSADSARPVRERVLLSPSVSSEGGVGFESV